MSPIRRLPGDSAPLGVINTGATRGGKEVFQFFGFGLLCSHTASNPITTEMHQVVFSNKEALKCLTESKGTPAMDLGHFNDGLK